MLLNGPLSLRLFRKTPHHHGAAAAVCVDDNLPSGHASVRLGSSRNKPPGRVDQVFDVVGPQLGRDHRVDDVLGYRFLDLSVADIGRVLSGQNNLFNDLRPSLLVPNGYLALGVRPEPWHSAVFANFSLFFNQPVGKPDGQGHQFRGLIHRKPKHHTLVACPEVVTTALNRLFDVTALPVQAVFEFEAVAVEAYSVVDIANVSDCIADDTPQSVVV